MSDPRIERSCGAIVFRLHGGVLQVLMVRHSARHWSFPKGHIEICETDKETAIREVFEETGIEITILSDFVEESTYSPRPGVKKTVRFFIGDYVGGVLSPQLEEVSNAEWMTPEEACELLTFDRDREIFRSALSHIGFAGAFSVNARYTIEELLQIMRFLRSDEGCPWDREQTHESIAGNMLEEAYEAVDAITSGNMEDLCEELGDVLMQVVFHTSMAEDKNLFDFDDVVSGICRKLISRHSHLFGDDQAKTPEEVLTIWNKNKDREKGLDSVSASLEAVSRGLPALTRALKLQKRAARVGFDWPDASGALDKIKEEYGEFCDALAVYRNIDTTGLVDTETTASTTVSDNFVKCQSANSQKGQSANSQSADKHFTNSRSSDGQSSFDQLAYSAKRKAVEEAGDLLFAVVNALRLSDIDPETALTMSSEKFIRRFSEVERLALSEGRKLESMTLEEMDVLWNQAKRMS
ncbi:MAG: nucleoside triphosphate pyrophosphohydrolase [Clostridiaceae bacterium]|nr:nucleoside triphosphate pyrophosphohydrolase [Clostridiaceae bacterium]